jgi:hypothetical protein
MVAVLIGLACLPIARLESRLVQARLNAVTNHPASLETVQQATRIVTSAEAARIDSDPQIVQKAGLRILQISKADQKLSQPAWAAVLKFLAYRSLLNRQYTPPSALGLVLQRLPLLPRHDPEIGKTRFTIDLEPQPERGWKWQATPVGPEASPAPSGTLDLDIPVSQEAVDAAPRGTVWFGEGAVGVVPSAQAAYIKEFPGLQRVKHGEGGQLGPALIVIESQIVPITLDGVRFKNVIVQNSRISYQGGPVELDNVYFVNCTFDIPRTEPSFELADRILAASATSFQSLPPP